jgi:hypothetical protein
MQEEAYLDGWSQQLAIAVFKHVYAHGFHFLFTISIILFKPSQTKIESIEYNHCHPVEMEVNIQLEIYL